MSTDLIAGFVAADVWWLARSTALIAALVALVWAYAQQRRATERLRAELVAEQRAMREALSDCSERIAAIGAAIAAAARPVAASEVASTARREPSRGGYEVAIRLARNGASIEELMATSGTTRTEAELLRRLHASATSSSMRDPVHASGL